MESIQTHRSLKYEFINQNSSLIRKIEFKYKVGKMNHTRKQQSASKKNYSKSSSSLVNTP